MTDAIPLIVSAALDDTRLTDTARLAMWHLRLRLDLLEYREVYVESLAAEMHRKPRTVNYAVEELITAGYLDAHAKRRPRALRFPLSRRIPALVRAA